MKFKYNQATLSQYNPRATYYEAIIINYLYTGLYDIYSSFTLIFFCKVIHISWFALYQYFINIRIRSGLDSKSERVELHYAMHDIQPIGIIHSFTLRRRCNAYAKPHIDIFLNRLPRDGKLPSTILPMRSVPR